MKFSRVLGKIEPEIVKKCERKMSDIFLELAVKVGNTAVSSGLGGDPLVFTLVAPSEHVLTRNIPTAATDGRRYYWNPEYVLDKTSAGLRILISHEALHSHFMHPSRVGNRDKKLWNYCVDWMVHDFIYEDFRSKKVSPSAEEFFLKHNKPNITVEKYVNFCKNPKNKTPEAELIRLWKQEKDRQNLNIVDLPEFDSDTELTPEQRAAVLEKASRILFCFADPNIPKDLKRAEKLYEHIWSNLPRCPKCARVGTYVDPEDIDPEEAKHFDEHEKHGKGCDLCSTKGYDVIDSGDTEDEHIPSDETPDESARRIARAIENAKRMGGSVPAGFEDELGILTAPVITWIDYVRIKFKQIKDGNTRNDWTRFKSRQLFAGQLIPKKTTGKVKYGVLLDTSGSMSRDDMADGVSQLASLPPGAEGKLVCADAEVYWDKMVDIRSPKTSELLKIKPVGRGGTMFAKFFDEYYQNFGKCDFLIILTDGGIFDADQMKDPGIPVVWVVTSPYTFDPPFGKKFQLG